MAFHWALDFGFDVLHYGGNETFRSSLIQAAIKTIRWFHEQAPNTPIILVGHSLGSVVAAQTLASLCATESWMSRVVLVTLGSPLNYISRAFPKSVPPARKLADAICAAGVRWINLWRLSDPIGKFLDIGRSGTVQDCVDKGGHMDYWSRAGGRVPSAWNW
jgi:pimeloyl-ACP methyl ester carboxylesterase